MFTSKSKAMIRNSRTWESDLHLCNKTLHTAGVFRGLDVPLLGAKLPGAKGSSPQEWGDEGWGVCVGNTSIGKIYHLMLSSDSVCMCEDVRV